MKDKHQDSMTTQEALDLIEDIIMLSPFQKQQVLDLINELKQQKDNSSGT